jgi:hypothetical protein
MLSLNSKRWLRPPPVAADARTFEARAWRAVAWCGALGLVALAFACSTHLGLTWDEPLQLRYGNRILAWYRSGFHDASALTYATPLFEYGGLFEAPAQFVAWLLPYEDVATRHVLPSLTAALGVVATWKLAARVGGARAGFIAALMLVLTPAWTGHGFFNSKDIPFGAAAAWALDSAIELATGPRPVPWRSVALAGLTTGIALGVRSGGVFLLGYPLLGVVARAWLDRRLARVAANGCESWPSADAGGARGSDGSGGRLARAGVASALLGAIGENARLRGVLAAAAFLAIAWSVMLLAWPWAQLAPISRPLAAIRHASHFGWGGEMLFRGKLVNAQAAPSDYLPTWFAITLPETYALAAVCAIALVVMWWRPRLAAAADRASKQQIDRSSIGAASGRGDADRSAGWTAERRNALIALSLFAFGSFGAVLAAIVLRPVEYDAQRHFLFVLPPLAALGGCAIAAWLGSARVPVALRAATGVLLITSCGLTLREMIALHPYEYVYFNRLEGGLAGAAQRFETDYWGASYEEGLAWVVHNLHPPNGKRLKVASCACFYETRRYIDQIAHAAGKFEVVKDGGAADIVLVGMRRSCPNASGKLVHVVQREGVPLLAVIRKERPRG